MIFIILFSRIGLSPDEAQYYTWSQSLDFGYYSKPPGIAWEIFLTTFFLGNSVLAVKMGPVTIGSLFSLAVFYLAKAAKLTPSGAFFAFLIAAFSPIGFFSTFLAITDGGMLLFWTLALIELTHSISESKTCRWFRFALYIALGALFKWPIYILWAVAFFKEKKISKEMLFAFIFSLLGLIPTLYWNYTHDFVTFKHVFTIVSGGNDGGSKGNPLEFLGSQAALLSPVIFLMFLYGVTKLKERSLTDAALFLGKISYSLFALFLLYSFFKKGQGNWCLFVYPSLFVFLAALFDSWKKLQKIAIITSIILSLFAFSIPSLPLPWKINPFKHTLGWQELSSKLQYDPQKEFLFSDKYQVVAELSFYLQSKVYFFNLLNLRKNQYSFYEPPTLKDGIFIAVEQNPRLTEKINEMKVFYSEELKKYFTSISETEVVTLLEEDGMAVKKALIIRGKGFKGELPKDPEKY